jgi:hypothetical protein
MTIGHILEVEEFFFYLKHVVHGQVVLYSLIFLILIVIEFYIYIIYSLIYVFSRTFTYFTL